MVMTTIFQSKKRHQPPVGTNPLGVRMTKDALLTQPPDIVTLETVARSGAIMRGV